MSSHEEGKANYLIELSVQSFVVNINDGGKLVVQDGNPDPGTCPTGHPTSGK